MTENIVIEKWPITLIQFLKWQGIAENGAFAKGLVREEKVMVNGKICTIAGLRLSENDIVQVEGIQENFCIKKKSCFDDLS